MKEQNIERLPKWAQDRIASLERQRDIAVKRLNEWTDTQTPSAISTTECDCTRDGSPEFRKKFIQGNAIEIEHSGVLLRVLLRDDRIDISYEPAKRLNTEVAIIPRCYCGIDLVAKSNLR